MSHILKTWGIFILFLIFFVFVWLAITINARSPVMAARITAYPPQLSTRTATYPAHSRPLLSVVPSQTNTITRTPTVEPSLTNTPTVTATATITRTPKPLRKIYLPVVGKS